MNQWITERMNQWINESMNQWTNQSMNQWTNESTNEWLNEAMTQWTMNQRVNEYNESKNQGINESKNRWINALFRLYLPKVLRSPQSFCDLALATVSCAFSQLHLPKVLWFCHFFFAILSANRALALYTVSQIEARTRGNTNPTSATPGATLPEKTQAMSGNVVTRELTGFRTVTLPNCLMWLTWWCEC